MVKGYCVKCKKKGQDMKDPVVEKTAKGGYMAKGQCAECDCKMCAMMSEENAQKAVDSGDAKKGY